MSLLSAYLRTNSNLMMKMVICNQLLLTHHYSLSIASGFTDEQLLSPQLERWKIVPDTFLIYKGMSNEVDPRLYQHFDKEQWSPPTIQWDRNVLDVYQLSVIVLVVLLVIFSAICILSGTYCFYHVLCTFFLRKGKYDLVREEESLSKDLVDDRVVNV